ACAWLVSALVREPLVDAHIPDDESLGVAAGDEQQQIREGEIVGEAGGQRMRLEVIDRDERQTSPERDCLSGNHADDESADLSRARGGRDSVERIEIELSFR